MTDETKSLIHIWVQLLNQSTYDNKGHVIPLLDDTRRKALSDKIMLETGILKSKDVTKEEE